MTAGQAVQLANGETISLMSGQDTQFSTGGALRAHTGPAIGVLASAVKEGEGGVGLQMIAAHDTVDVQAQSDTLDVQARKDVQIVSANAHIDWAAAKRISLSTADGANITIEGGNITVQCPGKITVHAGKKSFAGPENQSYPLPGLPTSICIDCLIKPEEFATSRMRVAPDCKAGQRYIPSGSITVMPYGKMKMFPVGQR